MERLNRPLGSGRIRAAMSDERIGIAIIERPLLRVLETLWEGPLQPADLPSIESTIRAFLISPILTVSRCDIRGLLTITDPNLPEVEYYEPFDDHLLDYEFSHPRESHPWVPLRESESSFLSNLIDTKLRAQIAAVLPDWLETEGQATAFFSAWYEGHTPDQCETAARDQGVATQLDVPLRGFVKCGYCRAQS
jgi:hypothetical protein